MLLWYRIFTVTLKSVRWEPTVLKRHLNAWLHPLPEAFLLGAQRSGTTYLHSALAAHPDIRNGVAKELHFFSLNWHKGLAEYHHRLPFRLPRWFYRSVGHKAPIAIDATPLYLFYPAVPERLVHVIGTQAKFVVLLREPGARAWSQYQMMLARGWEPLGFREAIEQEQARTTGPTAEEPDLNSHSALRHFSYVARGRYAEQLERWWALVPRERFLLLRSEDLYRDPQTSLARVLEFLELEPMPLRGTLDKNSYARMPLPAPMRQRLDDIFAGPNSELLKLTGIGW